MDYYFSAAGAVDALRARELDGGPGEGFDCVPAKDVIVCPHLELLVTAATGEAVPSAVRELRTIWPPEGTPAPVNEDSPFLTGPTLSEIPNRLRDALAAVEVSQQVSQAWAGDLWGYDPGDADRTARALVGLARRARSEGKYLYWWSEL